jgi:hypothetical protein
MLHYHSHHFQRQKHSMILSRGAACVQNVHTYASMERTSRQLTLPQGVSCLLAPIDYNKHTLFPAAVVGVAVKRRATSEQRQVLGYLPERRVTPLHSLLLMLLSNCNLWSSCGAAPLSTHSRLSGNTVQARVDIACLTACDQEPFTPGLLWC